MMAGQAEMMMGSEEEARPSPPRRSEVQMRKNDQCFHCKKQGHWAKECPARTKTPGRSSPPSAHLEMRPWVCRCSGGTCLVKTISGVKQYCCPGGKENGENCGFQMPCELAVFDDSVTPCPPICTCKAGFSRTYRMDEGPNAGREYYGCSIKKGDGACSFFKWCDQHVDDNQEYHGPTQCMNSGNDKRGNAIPLADELDELGELEMQFFQDACKRKSDDMNQAECSSEPKKMKMAMSAGIYPRIESDQLGSPENIANITDFIQVTPAPIASSGSAEVASPGMENFPNENFPNDSAEINLNISSPKGCTRHTALFEHIACAFWVCCMLLRFGVTAITRLLNLADPEEKTKATDPILKADFSVNGGSQLFSNTQRRLEFDEAVCVDSVSDKILALIGTCIRYGSSSTGVTHSPVVAAHSIISLSQSSTVSTGGKLFAEENKISRSLFSSNDSSLLCILGLLKSTPLKDLPNFEDGIRLLISDFDTTSKESKILNRVLECLLFLADAYRAKEMAPSFTPTEEEFRQSQAVIKDEIFKLTNECSKATASLREASLQVEQCRADNQKAQLEVKALETQLIKAQMEAAEMMARVEEAEERLNELKEENTMMARKLGELVLRRASEDYEQQERIAAFDAADKKRVTELGILEEAAEVVVRMLEGEL